MDPKRRNVVIKRRRWRIIQERASIGGKRLRATRVMGTHFTGGFPYHVPYPTTSLNTILEHCNHTHQQSLTIMLQLFMLITNPITWTWLNYKKEEKQLISSAKLVHNKIHLYYNHTISYMLLISSWGVFQPWSHHWRWHSQW